ncbi:MAG: oligosaccharide flippase family protein [Acidobacteria bacterium]|nr:oligosaccharide flippase family protein [Acidobacteriota bacterium]
MLRIFFAIGTIQVLIIIVNLVRSKVIAVLLGPEGIGVISVVDQIVQVVAQITAFSVPFSAVKFLSRSHSEGIEAFKKTYSVLLRLLLWLAFTGAAISVGLVGLSGDLLSREILPYRSVLIVALLAVPIMALGGFTSNVLAAAQKPRLSATLTLVMVVAIALAACIGVPLWGIPGLYWSSLLAGTLVTVAVLAYLYREFRLPVWNGSGSIVRELKSNPEIVLFSLILYIASFTHPLSYLIARYSVLKNLGEAQAGLLHAAIILAGSMGMVIAPVNGLFLTPIVNRNIAKKEKMQRAIEFQKKLVLIFTVAAIPVVLFPKLILTLLLSSLFAEASKFIFAFVVSQYLLLLAGVFQALIIGLDDLKTYGLICLAGHSIAGLFSWLLVPHYGIHGVSTAFVISGSGIFGMTWMRLRGKHGFTMTSSSILLMIYGLAAVSVASLLFGKHEDLGIQTVSLKSGFYLLFLGSVFLFILDKRERNSLWRLFPRTEAGKMPER